MLGSVLKRQCWAGLSLLNCGGRFLRLVWRSEGRLGGLFSTGRVRLTRARWFGCLLCACASRTGWHLYPYGTPGPVVGVLEQTHPIRKATAALTIFVVLDPIHPSGITCSSVGGPTLLGLRKSRRLSRGFLYYIEARNPRKWSWIRVRPRNPQKPRANASF